MKARPGGRAFVFLLFILSFAVISAHLGKIVFALTFSAEESAHFDKIEFYADLPRKKVSAFRGILLSR